MFFKHALELLSVFLSDSLNYLPEKTVIMSRLMLYIFFQVWSATAGFPAPWFFPVTTGKFPTAAIICIYWCHAFHIKMLFYPQYASLSASDYTSFPLLHIFIVHVIEENINYQFVKHTIPSKNIFVNKKWRYFRFRKSHFRLYHFHNITVNSICHMKISNNKQKYSLKQKYCLFSKQLCLLSFFYWAYALLV